MFYRFILSNYVAVFRSLLPYEQVNMFIVIQNVVAGLLIMPAYLMYVYFNTFAQNLCQVLRRQICSLLMTSLRTNAEVP